MLVKLNPLQIMRVLAWSMPLYIALFAVAFAWLGHMLPPHDGAFPTDQLARHFMQYRNELRVGFALGASCAPFYGMFSIAVFGVMRRMEGRDGLLSYVQLIGGALTSAVPMLAFIIWLAAAYRPEMPPANIQMLYDLGWLTIDLGYMPTTLQMVAMGVLFLADPRPVPLFPKWLNWLGIWLALEFMAEIIMPYFRSGPFSWSGLFNFYIPYGGPFAWLGFVFFYMLRAISRLEREALGAPSLTLAA